MKNDSPKQRVLKALMGGNLDRPPVTSLAGCGGAVNVEMQAATGIFWPQAHKNPKQLAALAIAAYELGGIECVKIPFDNVIEAEALGCETRYPEKSHLYPIVTSHPYAMQEHLSIPENLLEKGRIPTVLEAIQIAREKVGDYLPVSSHVVGPFTLAVELVGLENFSIWSLKKRDYVKSIIDKTTEVITKFAQAQYRAGSDIVTVADGALAPIMVTQEVLHEIIKPALIQISSNLGGIRLLYIGGKIESMVPYLIECGFDGVSVDESVKIERIKPKAGNVKILGNVSSKKTLTSGTVDEVRAEVKRAIDGGADLIEPSCGIPPETPSINIQAMVEAVFEFGIRK
jgi:[methyl-Co(III) methanol-specific corrinoid protein]:coenzyme M methyltransferase